MSRSYKDAVGGHSRRDIGIYQGGRLSGISWGEGWRRFAKQHESRRQRRLIPALIQLGLEDQSWIAHADEEHWDSIYEEDWGLNDDPWHGWNDDYDRYDFDDDYDDSLDRYYEDSRFLWDDYESELEYL